MDREARSEHNGQLSYGPLDMDKSEEEDDDDDVQQRDDERRFVRYDDVIGEGRFKVVYRGFDEKAGIDIAWGVIRGDVNNLDEEATSQLLLDIERGTGLNHKNIIRCYKCWTSHNEINLITELFTSGNLRDYRHEHNQLDSSALRKFCRQILLGLDYLHSQAPAVIHGDLRCDKIYVNGHSGEIKIGDLGLFILLARKYAQSEAGSPYRSIVQGQHQVKQSTDVDIFAFGLCMLELYTQLEMDPQQAHDHEALIDTVTDEGARSILTLCLLSPPGVRPSARLLMDQPYFAIPKKQAPSRQSTPSLSLSLPPHPDASHPPASPLDPDLQRLADSLLAQQAAQAARPDPYAPPRSAISIEHLPDSDALANGADEMGIKRCCVRGEDLTFAITGAFAPSSPTTGVSITLTMTSLDKQDDEVTPCFSRTVQFDFNTDDDTPESVGTELQSEFKLSETDTEIVSAVIKEWLDHSADDGARSQLRRSEEQHPGSK